MNDVFQSDLKVGKIYENIVLEKIQEKLTFKTEEKY